MKYNKCIILFSLLLILNNHIYSQNIDINTWQKDFDFVVGNILKYHPNPFYRISRSDFEKIVEKQKEAIAGASSDEECLIAIMKVVASLRDGHTQIYPVDNFNTNKFLPLRSYVFEDGIYIISTLEKYKSLIGSKLIEINGIPVNEVESGLNKIIPSDNNFGRMNFLPMYLSNTGYLKGLGIVQSTDTVRLKIQTDEGQTEDILINTIEASSNTTWFKRSFKGPGAYKYISPFDTDIPQYLYPFYEDYENFRFTYPEDKKHIYMQINQLIDSPDKSFSDFQNEFWRYFDKNANDIESFILDLRFNTGGNGPLITGFVKELIKREEILKTKEFSVIIGRQTFSAAIILVSQLKTYTNAVFIGEPMGGPLHLWSTALQLGQVPGGKFEFHVSYMEFFLDLPAEKNYMFPPQIPVVSGSTDFFSGRDKVLEYILDNDTHSQSFNLKDEIYKDEVSEIMSVMEAWSKGLIDEQNLMSAKAKAQKLNYKWKFYDNECGFYAYGSQIREPYLKFELLMVANNYAAGDKPEYAGAFFEFLTILFPEYKNGWLSYGNFLNKCREEERAAYCFQKAR